MSNQHPIIPPPELLDQWCMENNWRDIAIQAAQWGADQELEACCEWVEFNFGQLPTHNLRQFRRPKPPSLKEQSLSELNLTADPDGAELSRTQVELIRKALEALPND